MRVLKIACPACHSGAVIRKTNRKHPQLADIYCSCSNVECGHTFVMNLSFSHTLSPSALSHSQVMKLLIDSVKPEEREGIIAMLNEAKKAEEIMVSASVSASKAVVTRRSAAE